jgi:transposase
VYEGSLTIEIYTRFLDRLARHHGCKVHLIADQHPTHKAAAVKDWLAEHADEIEQHFLPGYSPELNPVELLNPDPPMSNAVLCPVGRPS